MRAATAPTPAMLASGSVNFQAKFFDVNGIKTRYYDEGQGDAMVMIHGSRFSPWGSANTWTQRNRDVAGRKAEGSLKAGRCKGQTCFTNSHWGPSVILQNAAAN